VAGMLSILLVAVVWKKALPPPSLP
jgi:hypothetical protein